MVSFMYLQFFFLSRYLFAFFLLHVEFEPRKTQKFWLNLNLGALPCHTPPVSNFQIQSLQHVAGTHFTTLAILTWILRDAAGQGCILGTIIAPWVSWADGNDAFQWPEAKSQERYPSKSGNLYVNMSDSFICLPILYLLPFIVRRH